MIAELDAIAHAQSPDLFVFTSAPTSCSPLGIYSVSLPSR